MRDMAQLRLQVGALADTFPFILLHPVMYFKVCVCVQLEVSQLEGSLEQPKAQSSMSPYLVPDAGALCQHLNLLRQLAASGCFIIIIPRTGPNPHPSALPAQ